MDEYADTFTNFTAADWGVVRALMREVAIETMRSKRWLSVLLEHCSAYAEILDESERGNLIDLQRFGQLSLDIPEQLIVTMTFWGRLSQALRSRHGRYKRHRQAMRSIISQASHLHTLPYNLDDYIDRSLRDTLIHMDERISEVPQFRHARSIEIVRDYGYVDPMFLGHFSVCTVLARQAEVVYIKRVEHDGTIHVTSHISLAVYAVAVQCLETVLLPALRDVTTRSLVEPTPLE